MCCAGAPPDGAPATLHRASCFVPGHPLDPGTGARIDPALRTGDVVVASHLYEHDYGSLTRDGMVYRPMNGPRNGAEVANEFQPPPGLLDLARQAMADYPPRTVTVDGAS